MRGPKALTNSELLAVILGGPEGSAGSGRAAESLLRRHGFKRLSELTVSECQETYGIGPATSEEDAINYGAHSDVERLPESSLYPFVKFIWNVVTEVAGHK